MPALENKRHEAFCHAYVSKRYATDAMNYVATVNANRPSVQADKLAANLLKPGTSVSIRIAEIRAEIAERFEQAKRDMDDTFLSIEEKRAFLARVKRCNYSTIEKGTFDFEKDGDLIQGIKQTKFGIEYVMPDKLKAIALDNDFPGGGGVPDTASKLLERLIRPGIPADRVPMMLDGPVVDVETNDQGMP